MAIGSAESAVLEIEVDAAPFEDGMSKMEQAAKRAERQITADIEKGVAAFDKQATAAEKAAERQEKAEDRAHKKAAIALAASIVAWKKFYDFIASGSGEASAAVRQLGTSVETLQSQVAEATASAMRPLVDVLNGIAIGAASSESAVSSLGRAIASLALGPAGGLGLAATGLGQGQARGWGMPNTAQRDLSTLSAQNEAARTSVGGRFAASMGAIPDLPTVIDTLEITPEARGGGGGGGETEAERAKKLAMALQAIAREHNAELLRLQQEYLAERKRKIDEQVEIERAAWEASLDAATARTREATQEHMSLWETALDARAEKDRFYAQEAIALEHKRAEALDATIAALEMVNQILLQGGPAAQAAARVMMAVQGAIYAQKAIGELGEAIAAAARYDAWGAVNHGAAAVQFGIAAGMKLGAAVGGGGGGARASGGGGRTGPAEMAAPRGSGGGSSGTTINATIVLNAAGEVVDDSTYRKLGRFIREIERRGY